MECPRCGKEMEGKRCLWCAYERKSTPDRPSDVEMIIGKSKYVLKLLTIFSFMGFLILSVAVMLWSAGLIIPETMDSSTIVFAVLIFVVGIFEASGYSFTVYYLFIISCILLSFVYLSYRDALSIRALFNKKEGGIPKIKDSPITRLAFSSSAMMFLYMVYLVILELANVSIRTPGLEELETWQMIYAITRATVWEELTIRVVYLGLPMLIYAKLKGEKDLTKYLTGGFGLDDRFVLWPIIISASIFAFAHLASWDIYKMIPTLLAGFFFGYLFAKDGLYSCILFHFAWNYTSVYSRLPSGWIEAVSILMLMWVLFGIYFSYHYSKKLLVWLIQPVSEIRQPKTKTEESKKTAGLSTGFICSNCNNHTAFYTDEGKLKCKRCGTEHDPTSPEAQESLDAKEVKREWPPPK